MPLPTETASSIRSNVDPSEIPKIIQTLRNNFNKDFTRPLKWRVSQLKALNRILTEGRDDICAALHADLHKSSFEGYMQEIALAQQEIYSTMQELEHWMSDEAVPTNMFTFPAASVIKKDPLGVVFCAGAWNYPGNVDLF